MGGGPLIQRYHAWVSRCREWVGVAWADGEPHAPVRRPTAMTRRTLAIIGALLLAGCLPVPTPTPGAGTGTLSVTAVAGPVCPVEQDPPDPGCAPRLVAGARIFVQPGDGRDILVAQGATDADGVVELELPAGDYIVVGGEVEGLMGLPEPATVTIEAGQAATITLTYDTGIR